MQQLALEQRGLLGDRAPWHVGDIAWGLRQHEGREAEWSIRLWVEDGRVVAWDGSARTSTATIRSCSTRCSPSSVHASPSRSRTMSTCARRSRGTASSGRSRRCTSSRVPLDDLPPPPALPDGFRYRTVEDGDVAERVGIHRDVWAPSRVTESSFVQVRATWPYRGSLDCVVEAPDGRFAAYALLWPDDEHGVGELEPVGVRETFRRRGFGTAICTYALRRWREEGGTRAVVYCKSDEAYALYRSIGFDCHATLHGYAR